jgi:hypothetical protein
LGRSQDCDQPLSFIKILGVFHVKPHEVKTIIAAFWTLQDAVGENALSAEQINLIMEDLVFTEITPEFRIAVRSFLTALMGQQ